MPDLEQDGENDFLIEKIKVKPVNKRKLIRKTLITAAMAVIFGLIACFTFLILEPVINNWLYPEEDPPVIVFPEDLEEMLPEEMLAENLPTESPEPTSAPEQEGVVLESEQIQEILSKVTLDLDNYVELYSVMSAYVSKIKNCMVSITAIKSAVSWFSDVQESRNLCSGVIIFDTGRELLVLTDYSSVMLAEKLLLTFQNNVIVEATLKRQDPETDLAVLAVDLEDMPAELIEEGFSVAPLGSSNVWNLTGMPVVALGSPMGSSNSVAYGMITSANTTLSLTDRNYNLLMTDISGSRNASGVLFNLKGQLIGVITNKRAEADMENLIGAFGISELQKIVEKMSNASDVAYMGIKGGDVPREVHQEFGVPYGAYVEKIDINSPAMRAGIQQGDVITGINDTTFTSFRGYSNFLLQAEPEQTVDVSVMRQAQGGEYREMSFSIELEKMK